MSCRYCGGRDDPGRRSCSVCRENQTERRNLYRDPKPKRKVLPSPWADEAACRDMDTALFFPERGEAPAVYVLLRVVCMACEVRRECLDDALYYESFENLLPVGFVGGMTPKERLAERRRRRGAADAFELLRASV